MAISYPLSLPTHTGIAQVEFRTTNAVAYSRSPFTFAGQAHAYAGQMWAADVSLPPMHRADAERWVAWLISLKGQLGTFYLGDPLGASSRGLASTFLGTPVITNQAGGTISVTGASASKTGWLLAGDYIQIGTGSSATLHKVLQDANTNAGGSASLEVWPHVRGTRSGSIAASDAVGNFRLSSNETSWSVNNASIYGISFSAMEAV
ncbi:hypothetical protein [Lentibacter algarum]|uniref:hypothetical protein n=1 Tax=Lentibacter algarum TaxID=576131 RepID=UPI0026ED2DD6|nr:hypothetical protein [Lentibacter algarum]